MPCRGSVCSSSSIVTINLHGATAGYGRLVLAQFFKETFNVMVVANEAAVSVLAGIDVSHYQQAVDWAAVARAGIHYSFIKATEGAHVVDSQFARNWAAA